MAEVELDAGTASTVDEARARAVRIRYGLANLAHLHDDIVAAYRHGDHRTLGYDSWEAYREGEYGDQLRRLSRAERPEVVATLRGEGLSTRAIAAVVGVDQSTVVRDLSSVDANASTAQVTGVDGKTYQPSRPAPASSGDPEDENEPDPPTLFAPPRAAPVMLTLRTHTGAEVPYPKPQGRATFNQTQGDGISWAAWSWNPVTGCLHGCPYCYAREIATNERFKASFPAGFTPLFHAERLDAPANTVIPPAHRDEPVPCHEDGCPFKRVFVCSMADLYGRWVPDEWIDQVHTSMLASPAWQYLLLTKFPARYVGLDLPPGAWVGTSVDEQKRVRIAEDAFRQIDGVTVKWLSLEPLLEPLEFTDLSMFDWVVIGAQTATMQPSGPVAAADPDPDWVLRILAQAREHGIPVHLKPNLRRSFWFNQYPQLVGGAR